MRRLSDTTCKAAMPSCLLLPNGILVTGLYRQPPPATIKPNHIKSMTDNQKREGWAANDCTSNGMVGQRARSLSRWEEGRQEGCGTRESYHKTPQQNFLVVQVRKYAITLIFIGSWNNETMRNVLGIRIFSRTCCHNLLQCLVQFLYNVYTS